MRRRRHSTHGLEDCRWAAPRVWTATGGRREAWELDHASGCVKLERGQRIVGLRRSVLARMRTSSALSRVDGWMADAQGADWAGCLQAAVRHEGKRGQWPAYELCRAPPSMFSRADG